MCVPVGWAVCVPHPPLTSLVSRNILSQQDSRNLFFFLLLNLAFAGVELLYGMWSNRSVASTLKYTPAVPLTPSCPPPSAPSPGSLGLISDAFHMVFDCTALLAGLVAVVITRWGPNERYTFGYVLFLVHQPCGPPAVWSASRVVHQPCGPPAVWSTSHVVRQPCGPPAVWSASHVVRQPCGPPAVWSTSRVVHQPCGPPAMWSASRVVHQPCGPPAMWSASRVVHQLCGPHSGLSRVSCIVNLLFSPTGTQLRQGRSHCWFYEFLVSVICGLLHLC